MQWLNVHALGEQFIEKVTGVRISQRAQKGEHLEGEHLEFKAHVRGWKMEIRKSHCVKACCRNLIAACGRSSVHTAGMVPRAKMFCSYHRNGTQITNRNTRRQDGGTCQQKKFYDECAKNATPSVNSRNLHARNGTARIKSAAASASLNMIEPAGGVEARR